MKSVTKNSVFNIIYTTANLAFPLITTMYVSRVLLPAGVGAVSYAQNLVNYFVTAAGGGLAIYGVREIAKQRDNLKEKNVVYSSLFTINFILTSLALLTYLILFVFGNGLILDKKLSAIFVLSIVFNFINIDWFYQGEEDYVYIAIRSIIIKFISTAAVILFVRTKQDCGIYALIIALAQGSNYIFNIFHARKFVKFGIKDISIKKHLTPLFYISASAFLWSIYSHIDITMLGKMVNKTVAGYYSNAFRIVEISINVCLAAITVLLPRLSIYYNTDRNKFVELVNKALDATIFISVPIFAGVIILSPELLSFLFGNAFLPGTPAMRVLSAMILIKTVANLLCYQLMICTGNEKKRLPAYIIACVLNIAMNWLLIPILGAVGAAIASVASEFFVDAYQYVYIKRRIPFSATKRGLLQAFLGTLIMALAVLLLKNYCKVGSLFTIILCTALGGIIYFVFNLVTGNRILSAILSKLLKPLRRR